MISIGTNKGMALIGDIKGQETAIDVSGLTSTYTFESPALEQFDTVSFEIKLSGMSGSEELNVYFTNTTGSNAGLTQATANIDSGVSNNLIEITDLTCRFVRLEFSNLSVGTIDHIIITAKK